MVAVLVGTIAAASAGQARHIEAPKRSTNVPTLIQPNAVVTPYAAATLPPGVVLPAIPPPPPGGGHYRRVRSANGSTITLSQGAACGGSTVYGLVVGCQVTAAVTKGAGVAGADQGYVLAPGAVTPVAYTFGNTVTLNTAGYWVFGAFNTTSNQWDDLLYVAVGGTAAVQMYDASGNAIKTTTADGSTRVTFTATGLTNGDNYVIGAESTSVTGQCAWLTNSNAVPTATPNGSLCNPNTATSSIPAVNGVLSAAWIPAATTSGTMTITVWDVSPAGGPVRVATEEITVVASQFKPTGASAPQLMPSWQFSQQNTFAPIVSPPAFAFYSSQEAAFGGASVTNVYARIAYPPSEAGDTYTAVITDPNGAVVFQQAENGTGAYANPNVNFNVNNYVNGALGFQAPLNLFGFRASTYSLTLLDTTAVRKNLLVAATAFRILGFSASAAWVPSGGSQTTTIVAAGAVKSQGQLVLTNSGDTVFGPSNGDAISEILISVNAGGLNDISFSGTASVHTATFADASGNTWNATITPGAGGYTYQIDFVATGGASLPANATLTSPAMWINNAGNACATGCPVTSQVRPVHGAGLSVDPNTFPLFTQNIVNPMQISTGTGTSQPYAALVHVGYVPSGGGAYTPGADAHRYNNASRTQHAVYALPALSQSAAGYDDVWRLDLTANGNGDGADVMLTFPPQFDVTNVLQSTQIGSPGNVFTAGKCALAPGNNYLCLSGSYGAGTQHVYFALPPPSQAFTYGDVATQLNAFGNFYQSSGTQASPVAAPNPPATIYDDQYLSSVDALAIAGYSLDATQIGAGFSPATVGQNKAGYPVTFTVTNANTALGNNPDSIDQIVVDVADQGAKTLAANGTATPSGWSLQGTTTVGGGATRRYWFSVCPAEVTPNDTYGPTAAAGNGSSINVPICSTTPGWKSASLAPAQSVQFPLLLTTQTTNITANVYAHGANGGGWSQAIPVTIAVSAGAAVSGFSAAGTYGNPSTVPNGSEPTIGLKSNANGDSFLDAVTNTGNSNVSSFAVTIPGKDLSGVNAYDGTYSWQFTGAPTIQPAAGDTSTYGCVLTTPAGAANSYVSAVGSTGTDGHIFVNGCALPPGKSVVVAFSALYPQTINETYRFPTKFNWMTYSSGTNTTDGVSAGEEWFSDQLISVTTSTSLIVYVPNPGTTVYPALVPADTAAPAVSLAACGGCQFLNAPNTIDFNAVTSGQTKNVVDGVLVRVINANAPNGWKLYASTSYNTAYSGGGQELQTAFDSTRSAGTNLHATQGGAPTTYYDLPTASPGLPLVDNGNNAAVQTPYDMLMSMQVRVGTELPPTTQSVATVTYTWIAN